MAKAIEVFVVILVVPDLSNADFQALIDYLENLGCIITASSADLGFIAVRAPKAMLSRIAKRRGVKSIEQGREYLAL